MVKAREPIAECPGVDVVQLDDLIACAVCHAALPTAAIRRDGAGDCPRCGRRYTCDRGIYDLTPVPPPDESVSSRWSAWNELQANGLTSYTRAPEFNLSVGSRP